MRLIDAESLSAMRFTHEMHDSEGRLYVPFDEVAEAIFNAPTIEAEPVKHGRWIPVSERLPEEDGYYLTYGDWPDGYLILAFKHIRNWKKGHFFIAPFWNSPSEIVDRAVIAWMPLPEPYKEGEAHETD